jgi:predicted dehydrogenase
VSHDARLRLGLVGAGLITQEAHLPAALASGRARVEAIVDPVSERAKRLAESAGIRPRIADGLGEVLDEIDAAVIATPNHTHHDLAVACLEAGVSVLIEKPLTRTAVDGEDMVRAARESRGVAAVGYCTRFLESVALLGELLGAGFFGSIRCFDYQFGAVSGWSSLSGFHLDREAVGGGLLVTTGTHFLDRMLHWFGPPREVALQDDSLGGPEANALGTVRFDGSLGAFEGRIRLSRTVALQPGFVMETDRGTVLLRDGEHAALRFRPGEQAGLESILRRSDGPRFDERPMYQHQMNDFVAACLDGTPPMVSIEDGLEVVRLVEAFYANRSPLRMDWYDDARRLHG